MQDNTQLYLIRHILIHARSALMLCSKSCLCAPSPQSQADPPHRLLHHRRRDTALHFITDASGSKFVQAVHTISHLASHDVIIGNGSFIPSYKITKCHDVTYMDVENAVLRYKCSGAFECRCSDTKVQVRMYEGS